MYKFVVTVQQDQISSRAYIIQNSHTSLQCLKIVHALTCPFVLWSFLVCSQPGKHSESYLIVASHINLKLIRAAPVGQISFTADSPPSTKSQAHPSFTGIPSIPSHCFELLSHTRPLSSQPSPTLTGSITKRLESFLPLPFFTGLVFPLPSVGELHWFSNWTFQRISIGTIQRGPY